MPYFDDLSSLEKESIKPTVPSLLNRIVIGSINLFLAKNGYIPNAAEIMQHEIIQKLRLRPSDVTAICDRYRYLLTRN